MTGFNPFASDEPDTFTETAVAVGVMYTDAWHHPRPPHWVTAGVTDLLLPDEIEREWASLGGWDGSLLNHVTYLIPRDDFRDGEENTFRRTHGLLTKGPMEFACEPQDIANLREAARAETEVPGVS
ncbi:hypothetical protein [Streptosporangium roseum]|uniref:hypothetical protein n=1 Tax=Streptosporangium roseum TaxID=2001 RepID=UPI00332A3933